MKLNNEVCVAFLQGSGWIQNHDKELTIYAKNEAIEEFAKRIRVELEDNAIYNMDAINTIIAQMQEETE